MTESPDVSLSIGRRIRAPVAAVFDAWLRPDQIRAWMKPRPEVLLTDVRTEPTVGGAFRIVMHTPSRDEVHEGRYLIVDRPTRLSFSWVSDAAGPASVVDISLLTTADDHTMILLKHYRLAGPGARENHREDWRRILDSLAAACEK